MLDSEAVKLYGEVTVVNDMAQEFIIMPIALVF